MTGLFGGWLPLLPVLAPLFGAAMSTVLWGRIGPQRTITLVATVVQLVGSIALLAVVLTDGVQVLQVGSWPAPFGISFAVDVLGAAMAVIAGVIGTAVAVYARADVDPATETEGFHPLYLGLLAGVAGAFLTGDLFNLYVWFEVMLIASFGLLAAGGRKAQIDATLRYGLLNLLGTTLFLVAIGWLYGLTGTLNMADLHGAVAAVENRAAVEAVGLLFLVAVGAKAALVPLFFWLPASYHTPLAGVSALFAGLLTKVGVYALIRIFTLIIDAEGTYLQPVLLWVAVLTMVIGVLGAVAQDDVRRILSFHIISQIGYIMMGVALFTPLAFVGAVFYVIHHIVVKANLFLVGGIAERLSGTGELKHMGGIYANRPEVAAAFAVPAASLSGLPPTSGFWAKLLLIQAAFAAEQYIVGAVALIVSVLTLVSMTKIWGEAFWKPVPVAGTVASLGRTTTLYLLLPSFALAGITLFIGLFAEPLVLVAQASAAQLLDPAIYVAAVLGARP